MCPQASLLLTWYTNSSRRSLVTRLASQGTSQLGWMSGTTCCTSLTILLMTALRGCAIISVGLLRMPR